MWIAIGIILFLAVLVIAVLLLPIYVIIKNDGESELKIRFRFLFKTYGDKSNPDNPLLKALKSAIGIDKLSVKTVKSGIKKGGLEVTLEQTVRVLLSLLKETGDLLSHSVCKKLYVHVISAGDDPADAAINYGICCSFVYPLVGFLKSNLKRVSKRGEDVRIECDFSGGEDSFDYHLVLRVRVLRIVAGLWHIIMREAKHQAEAQEL
jgi:hypothetical protein